MRKLIRRTALLLIFILLTGKAQSQTFTEQTAIILPGLSNGSAEWGDYDNDGKLDLLLAGLDASDNTTLKLFRNNGAGSFSEQSIFSPATNATYSDQRFSAFWSDIDQDGDLDIVVEGNSDYGQHSLQVYRNDCPTNSFTRKFSKDFIIWQGSTAKCSDFDNDGDIDILLITSVSSKLLRNQGNFTFNEEELPLSGISSLTESTVAPWDYDNDGDEDLYIFGNSDFTGGTSAFYRNTGGGVFEKHSSESFPSIYKGSADWGDYNNDGYADLLMTGSGGTWIVKNNAGSSFTTISAFPLFHGRDGDCKWGDLDNDGDLDVIVSGNNNGTFITRIYINNGNDSFVLSPVNITGATFSSIGLGDYDNDNDIDICITGYTGTVKFTKIYRNDSSLNSIPQAPTGLTWTVSGNDVILAWNPLTTDNTPSGSLTYNVRVGTASGGINLVSPESSSTGYRRKAEPGNARNGTSFKLRNIKKQTYYCSVQAIDNSFKGSAFSTETSFTYTGSVQAAGLRVNSVEGKYCSLGWCRGNGDKCVVFVKEGNSGSASPQNGMIYSASQVFKSGTQIGATGWYCVYNGIGYSVDVSGLNTNTDYLFMVFEVDGTSIYNTQSSAGNPLLFHTGYFSELRGVALDPVTYSAFNYSCSHWIDIDNDGDLDLLTVGNKASKLYRNDGSDIFTPLSTPLIPGTSASCGDYNNDGLTDIAIFKDVTKIYRNDGAGSFTEQASIVLPGSYSGSVDWGDYDNDGDLDLVLAGQSSTEGCWTKIFRNNGDNTFTEQPGITLMGVGGATTTRWTDYNNDGFADLLIAGTSNSSDDSVAIYRNNRNKGFTLVTGTHFRHADGSTYTWGDYDNDGDLDILMAKARDNSALFRNDGNDMFTRQDDIILPNAGFGSASFGDFDKDGDNDILLTGKIGFPVPVTKIFTRNGNTYSEDIIDRLAQVAYSSGTWGDYDKDGDLDLVLTGNTENGPVCKIYRNDMVAGNITPAAPTGITASVDKSDVVLAWRGVHPANARYSMSYNIRIGTSSGGVNTISPSSAADGFRRISKLGNCYLDTALTLKKLPFGNYFWSVQAINNRYIGGPFSSQGTFSVVPVQASKLNAQIISATSLKLRWERGNGDRCIVFCKQTSTETAAPVNNTGYIPDPECGYGSQLGSTGWYCVYNGRGDSVIVSGLINGKEYSFHVIEYMGNYGAEQYFTATADGNPGVFSTSLFAEQKGIILPNANSNNIEWGDYDNDGYIDLLLPGIPSKIYKNNGNNTFTDQSITLAQSNNGSAAWGDYDNDGDLDIVMSGVSETLTPFTKIFRNNGSNSFIEQTAISITPVYHSDVEWGDYDGDGDLDLLICGATGTDPDFQPVSKVYRNNGNNTFTEQTQIHLTGVLRGTARWVDYDNDGDLDIHLTGSTDYQDWVSDVCLIYRNNGDDTFTCQTVNGLEGFSRSSVGWADFDNDGDLDLAIAKRSIMKVFQNNGNNNFQQVLVATMSYYDASYVAWGDYDNDGWMDLLLTNPNLDTRIFHNTQGKKSTEPIWFDQINDAALQAAGYAGASWADYDNDGDIDFVLWEAGFASVLYKTNLIMKSGMYSANRRPGMPLHTSAENSTTGLKLSWSSVPNDETLYKTMSYNVQMGTSKYTSNTVPSNSSPTGYRSIPLIGNAQTDTTFLLKNMPAGKYYWRVQAVDQAFKGGTWSALDSVDVKTVIASFTSNTVCQGIKTVFVNNSVSYGEAIQGYFWDFSDGTSSTLKDPDHVFGSAGTKKVKLIVYTPTNSDTLVKDVLIRQNPPVDFSASVACQGAETLIENKTNTSGLNITSWTWDYGDSKGSILSNPVSHGYLTAGEYNMSLTAVDDKGCSGSITKKVSVSEIPSSVITAIGASSICAGDSLTLTTPDNASYIYTWKLNGTPQASLMGKSIYTANKSGIYTVEIINPKGDCPSVSNTPVKVDIKDSPVKPEIQALNYTSGQCPGENPVKLATQNVEGYHYRWMMNGIPLPKETSSSIEFYEPGNYRLIADLNGCTDTSAVFTAQFPQGPENPVIYAEGPTAWYLACSIMNPAYKYKWYYNGSLVEGADKYYFMANRNLGVYRVSVGDENGCYTKSDSLSIPLVYTDIDDSETFDGLNIYPNPSDGLVFLELENSYTGKVKAEVFSPEGKKVLSKEFNKQDNNFREMIDMSGQSEGYYLINIYMNDHRVTKKVMIK